MDVWGEGAAEKEGWKTLCCGAQADGDGRQDGRFPATVEADKEIEIFTKRDGDMDMIQEVDQLHSFHNAGRTP